MPKQSFSSGQTLLSSQMNDLQTNDFNQTVSTKTAAYTFVVGDRGTRVVLNDTTARTFTIDDAIFSAGDTIQVHNINTGVLTIAAGAGVTLNGADVLTVAQYQGGTIFFTSASSAIFFPTAKTVAAAGLVFVTSATFSASAAVAFANDTFTSTYNNYLVVMNFGSSASSTTLALQVRDNSGTKSTSNYFSGTTAMRYTGSTANRNTNAGSSATLFGMGGSGSNAIENVMFMVSNPTSATSNTVCTFYFYADDAGGAGGVRYGEAEAHTGLVFTPSSGTITGTYRVYGIANS